MIEEEHTIHFADHEVFLSFTYDEDGIAFHEWWDSGDGEAAFTAWRIAQAEHR